MTEYREPLDLQSPDSISTGFLALLPEFRDHALIHFRDVACPDRRADAVAEAVALAWKWYRRLRERGHDVSCLPMAFAALVAKAVRRGRRLCGRDKAVDVLSVVAQQRRGFKVESLRPSARNSFEDRCSRLPSE